MENFLFDIGSWFGLIGTASLALVTYLTKTYLAPYLRTGNRLLYAKYIAAIADELTDDLIARYPDNEWLEHLDDVVDKVIEICGISPEVARRATRAAAARK